MQSEQPPKRSEPGQGSSMAVDLTEALEALDLAVAKAAGVVGDEAVAAGLEQLQVNAQAETRRTDRADGLVGPVGHRDRQRGRLPVDHRCRRAIGGTIDLDRLQGLRRARAFQKESDRVLGRPAAEPELAPPLFEPHPIDPGPLPRREPVVAGWNLRHRL